MPATTEAQRKAKDVAGDRNDYNRVRAQLKAMGIDVTSYGDYDAGDLWIGRRGSPMESWKSATDLEDALRKGMAMSKTKDQRTVKHIHVHLPRKGYRVGDRHPTKDDQWTAKHIGNYIFEVVNTNTGEKIQVKADTDVEAISKAKRQLGSAQDSKTKDMPPQAHKGLVIQQRTDGEFDVVDFKGTVRHTCASLEEAKRWIEEYDNKEHDGAKDPLLEGETERQDPAVNKPMSAMQEYHAAQAKKHRRDAAEWASKAKKGEDEAAANRADFHTRKAAEHDEKAKARDSVFDAVFSRTRSRFAAAYASTKASLGVPAKDAIAAGVAKAKKTKDCGCGGGVKDMTFTLSAAVAELKDIGMTLTKLDNEYRVNHVGGSEGTAYYTDDLQDAVDTGKQMAKNKKE